MTEGEAVGVEFFFEPDHLLESDDVRALALSLAIDRGGQTCPVSDYDVRRARAIITGEVKEVDRLKAELTHLRELVALAEKALERQLDNMIFVINHASLYAWADKFSREVEEDRLALTKLQASHEE